jgi:hypothetical protein
LNASYRDDLLSTLNASSNVRCDEAAKKLLSALRKISEEKGCPASVRKNATYLMTWLAAAPMERGARERTKPTNNDERRRGNRDDER